MKFATLSLGCKVNRYELDAVEELFLENGFEKDDKKPDVYVINSCSVTSIADKKSRQMIHRVRHTFSDLKCLLVMGCYSQVNAQEAIANGADVVIGTKYRCLAYELVTSFLQNKTKMIKIDENIRHSDYENFAVIPNISETRAYVKIQDGCDNFCSYCIIPYTRGNSRSREKQKIIDEISSLVNRGYKEVVLTGIHTGGYRVIENGHEYRLSNLIKDIFLHIPSLYRLRISSIEESEIDDELLNILKAEKRLANHFHVPLQSGSAAVLKRMHRKYTTSDFIDKIERIRKISPDIAITTDVIVGFPGETDEEFQETINLIKKINFSELHVFPFSSRSHTLASTMPNQVSPQIKKQRVDELLKISDELNRCYSKRFDGQKLEVLFEDFNQSEKKYRGHTSNYLEIKISSPTNLCGKIVLVSYND
ncbi:MAG: tRNA (N(6)-L-threonylcarbamoyladenosine(37)-C(2))-methylthiotransferase MtaB [Bacilli bacterium]|jgi:threonylcarbamoyladenosine tRNA methylthiotransferase MtaB